MSSLHRQFPDSLIHVMDVNYVGCGIVDFRAANINISWSGDIFAASQHFKCTIGKSLRRLLLFPVHL